MELFIVGLTQRPETGTNICRQLRFVMCAEDAEDAMGQVTESHIHLWQQGCPLLDVEPLQSTVMLTNTVPVEVAEQWRTA